MLILRVKFVQFFSAILTFLPLPMEARTTVWQVSCVKLKNYATIEFCIFRGTLRCQTIIAALQLVDEICRAAISMSDEQMQDLSWSDFVSVLDKSACPELIEYLKIRRLYVNEPQIGEEDV